MTKLPYNPFDENEHFDDLTKLYKNNLEPNEFYIIFKIPSDYMKNQYNNKKLNLLNFKSELLKHEPKYEINFKKSEAHHASDLAVIMNELLMFVKLAQRRNSVRYRAAADPSLN